MASPRPIFGMRLDRAKSGFFDRALVIGAMDEATRKALSKFGAFVRQRARSSIRNRKKASQPGSPPHGHVGLLKRFILFSFDKINRSVVIGPALLNGRAYKDAPTALEHGGTFQRRGRNGPYWAKYPARPFMGPAFEKEKAKAPDLWAGALKR